MARGNQREVDRERARKRNGDKGSNNKNEHKSDFNKTKETYFKNDLDMLRSCE